MDKNEFPIIVGWVIILLIPVILLGIYFSNSNNQSDSSDNTPADEENNNGNDNKNSNGNGDGTHWGVDSASKVDKDLYQCVGDNFGQPKVWGRYLGDIEDVSVGLTSDEADYLHENDVKILVIYNHFEDATGYDHGARHAQKAIDYADDLGISDGVALFGDIEPKFPVDSAFIEGWHDTLADSAYEPGLYGVFDEDSKLLEAYNAAKQDARENTVVWTAYPQKEITTKDNAPDYNPQGPDDAMVYGWQYAIESNKCNIDTDLFKDEMLDYLW